MIVAALAPLTLLPARRQALFNFELGKVKP